VTEETRLIEWNSIKAAVAQCKDISVMSKMNYSIEAIQRWAKQSKQSLETQNEIAEYRLRLNRKQGEWIEANIPEEGGNPQLRKKTELEVHTLPDVGIGENDSRKFRILARIAQEKLDRYITESKESYIEITTNDACRLWNKAHVSQGTGNNEWYTPEVYIEAARKTMGSIDTDPASSDIANTIVKAVTYYTAEDDGRQKPWAGNVWLNPPYAQPLISQFCQLLVQKYKGGETRQACVLVNNATETNFYQDMLRECSSVCFIKGRVKFVDEAGIESGAPLQGQTVLYFGPNRKMFAKCFAGFGVILYA